MIEDHVQSKFDVRIQGNFSRKRVMYFSWVVRRDLLGRLMGDMQDIPLNLSAALVQVCPCEHS